VYDFQKRSSVIRISREGAMKLGPIASELARGEGLTAHARAAELRCSRSQPGSANAQGHRWARGPPPSSAMRNGRLALSSSLKVVLDEQGDKVGARPEVQGEALPGGQRRVAPVSHGAHHLAHLDRGSADEHLIALDQHHTTRLDRRTVTDCHHRLAIGRGVGPLTSR